MARCSVCDHMEDHYSSTTPYLNRTTHSKTRWRPDFSEFQCDDCYNSIKTCYPLQPIDPEQGDLEHIVDNSDENEIQVEVGPVAPSLSEVSID